MNPFASYYQNFSSTGIPISHQPPSVTIGGVSLSLPADYNFNYPIWKLLRDFYAGEHVVKAKQTLYLRQLSIHTTPKEYEAYLSRAYFYNATRRTHAGLIGSLMRKPPEVQLSPGFNYDLDSVTRDGKSLHQFITQISSEVILIGRYGVLADLPTSPDNLGTTRPYLCGYPAESIPFWRTITHNGRTIIDRIVLMEEEIVYDDISTKSQTIYRVLRLDLDPTTGDLVYSQEIHRPAVPLDNSLANPNRSLDSLPTLSERIVPTVQGRTLNYIPFVFFSPVDLGTGIHQSPIYDIAMINKAHYESTALLEHGRFYAGMPTYYIIGDQQDALGELGAELGAAQPMKVGPSTIWSLPKDAKAGLLEFTGHGLTYLENAVESKQVQMQSLGGRLIAAQKRAAGLSSEAFSLMETGDEATLLSIAYAVGDGTSKLLNYLADLSNVPNPTGCKVEMNKEFVRTELSAREIRSIQALYERRLIPLDVLYYTLREVGIIPQEYSLEDFKSLLSSPDQLHTDPKLNPNPNDPPVDLARQRALQELRDRNNQDVRTGQGENQ
jgi:hypothetical protein